MTTTSNHVEYLENLLASHTDANPKLSAVITGGGVSIAELLQVPGASKMVSGIYLPYAFDETSSFISHWSGLGAASAFSKKTVSAEAADILVDTLRRCDGNKNAETRNVISLAITAAITTNRARRGNNEAFIAIEPTGIRAHLTLPKLADSQFLDKVDGYVKWLIRTTRQQEDQKIARVGLMLTFDPTNPWIADLVRNGELHVERKSR